MSFVDNLRQAKGLIREQRRLSVRALGRELDLAGDDLEELIDELVEIQQLVAREGRALVWCGDAETPPPAPRFIW